MAIAIKPLRKFTTGTPTTGDMVEGEIAVNTADQKIWMRDNANNIVEIGNVSAGGGSSVTIGENAPGGPSAGDMWWDSSDDQGRLKVYYNDGNSSQWVDAFPSIAPVEDRVILNGTDGSSTNAGDELLGEDNSFVQLESATTDFFDNPIIESIQFSNSSNAYLTTLSAASTADTNVDISNYNSLTTEDDVIGLIMAMG